MNWYEDTGVGVRQFRVENLQDVMNVDLKSYDYEWNKRQWLLNSERTHVAVTIEKRAIGFWVADQQGDNIRVVKLAVSPGYRRKGVGRVLLHDLSRHYASAKRITFVVGRSQTPAIAFLEETGFRVVETIDNYSVIGGVEDGFVYCTGIDRSTV